VLAVVLGCIPVRGMSSDTMVERRLVKFGFNAMNEQERANLFKQIDDYASFEAFLMACNSPSSIERRVIKGVAACVTPDALQKVSNYFRSKLAGPPPKVISCEDPQTKDLIARIHQLIDARVKEVTKLCSECFICKL
jgi:hypothetical protein